MKAIWLGTIELIRVQSTSMSTYRQGCPGIRKQSIRGFLPILTKGASGRAAPNPNGHRGRLTKGPRAEPIHASLKLKMKVAGLVTEW